MTPLRRSAAFVAFLVIFCNPIIKDRTATITVSALVSKINHKRQSTREGRIHENNNKILPPLSDTIIHVGNLDWKLPVDDVSGMITQAIIAKVVSEDDGNDNGLDGGSFAFEVKVVELPVPKRKRDEGKFHQGSAKVSFASAGNARLAMEALQQQQCCLEASNGTTNAKDWKVRWAPRSALLGAKQQRSEALSPERIEHRKKRAEKYARKRKRVAEATDQVIESLLAKLDLDDSCSADRDLLTNRIPVLEAPLLDWNTCPEDIDPMGGGRIRTGTQRGERKRAAVEAFLEVAREFLLTALDTDIERGNNDSDINDNDGGDNNSAAARDRPRRTVADLGCGAGNLTVPLAWWLKQLGFNVLGVDINDQALTLLSERAKRLGITIRTLQTDLLKLSSFNNNQDPDAYCDNTSDLSGCAAVVSLHACGAASDLSMAAAVRHNLPFAISPCCIGKISTERTRKPANGRMLPKTFLTSAERSAAPPTVVSYPRSAWLGKALPYQDDYKLLAAAADYGVGGDSNSAGNKGEVDERELARRKRCRLSKKIIEIDRLQWAKENGYCIRLLEMPRIGPLYPKRELLLGAKEGSFAASKLSQLPTVVL
jgi:SAM-dependent methyltransferase